MQKKLIALAVAGALAAPLAAQAETTIYGKMHVSIDSFSNDNSKASDTLTGTDSGVGVSSNSSRLGFKGSEDLGGGLKAVWQAESTVGVGDQKSSFSARNTFAGLAGGWGTLITGRHDTPYKTVGRKVDLFGDTVGDSRTVINNSGHDARTDNTIAYITPNMGGLTAVLAYVTDTRSSVKPIGTAITDTYALLPAPKPAYTGDASGTMDNNKWDAYSASLNYANGPLFVAAAYQSVSVPVDVVAYNGSLVKAADTTAARLAASFKFGGSKITALYQDVKAKGGVDGADRTTYGVGYGFTFGNNTIKAQYYAAGELDNAKNTDFTKTAVGFDHAFSKTTSVYLDYAAVSNGNASSVNVAASSGHGDQGPSGTSAGGSPNVISLGMIHKF